MTTHIYTVYMHPRGQRELVKQGWSWPGFCFSGVWLLVKGRWLFGVLLLAGVFLTGFVGRTLDVESQPVVAGICTLAGLLFAIGLGTTGNALQGTILEREGFTLQGTVQGTTPTNALATYLDSLHRPPETADPVQAA
jgi:hypothetical protein